MQIGFQKFLVSRSRFGSWRLFLLQIFTIIFFSLQLHGAEVMPPRPPHYFNDEAHVVPANVTQELDKKLEAFERETSDQVVVAVFPKMQSDSSIEDFTQRIAQKWQVGQKDKRNGVVLFVFIQDRKMFIQVGYGLEGALPDALAKRIVEDEIKPFFKSGDYAGGLTAGVNGILQAVKGEYKGTGRTVAESRGRGSFRNSAVFFVFFAFIAISILRRLMRRGTVYSGAGRGRYSSGPVFWGGGGGWGGGSSGGGGGGFSGGGGSFGGGGAGGSW